MVLFSAQSYSKTLHRLRFILLLLWAGVGVTAVFFVNTFLNSTTLSFVPPEGTPSRTAMNEKASLFPNATSTVAVVIYWEGNADSGASSSPPTSSPPAAPSLPPAIQNITSVKKFVGQLSEQLVEKASKVSLEITVADYYLLSDLNATDLAGALLSNGTSSSPALVVPVLLVCEFTDSICKSFAKTIYDTSKNLESSVLQNVSINNGFESAATTKRLRAAVTGMPLLLNDFVSQMKAEMLRVDIIVLPIALVILCLTVRSMRLLVLPLVALGVGLAVSFSCMYGLSKAMGSVSSACPPLMLTLSIAVTIDSSIILLSRFTSEVRAALQATDKQLLATAGAAAPPASKKKKPFQQQQQNVSIRSKRSRKSLDDEDNEFRDSRRNLNRVSQQRHNELEVDNRDLLLMRQEQEQYDRKQESREKHAAALYGSAGFLVGDDDKEFLHYASNIKYASSPTSSSVASSTRASAVAEAAAAAAVEAAGRGSRNKRPGNASFGVRIDFGGDGKDRSSSTSSDSDSSDAEQEPEPMNQKQQQQPLPLFSTSAIITEERIIAIVGNVLGSAGVAVLVSNTTLATAFVCMIAFPTHLISTLGVACSLTVFCVLLVSLNLVPTLLLTFRGFFAGAAEPSCVLRQDSCAYDSVKCLMPLLRLLGVEHESTTDHYVLAKLRGADGAARSAGTSRDMSPRISPVQQQQPLAQQPAAAAAAVVPPSSTPRPTTANNEGKNHGEHEEGEEEEDFDEETAAGHETQQQHNNDFLYEDELDDSETQFIPKAKKVDGAAPSAAAARKQQRQPVATTAEEESDSDDESDAGFVPKAAAASTRGSSSNNSRRVPVKSESDSSNNDTPPSPQQQQQQQRKQQQSTKLSAAPKQKKASVFAADDDSSSSSSSSEEEPKRRGSKMGSAASAAVPGVPNSRSKKQASPVLVADDTGSDTSSNFSPSTVDLSQPELTTLEKLALRSKDRKDRKQDHIEQQRKQALAREREEAAAKGVGRGIGKIGTAAWNASFDLSKEAAEDFLRGVKDTDVNDGKAPPQQQQGNKKTNKKQVDAVGNDYDDDGDNATATATKKKKHQQQQPPHHSLHNLEAESYAYDDPYKIYETAGGAQQQNDDSSTSSSDDDEIDPEDLFTVKGLNPKPPKLSAAIEKSPTAKAAAAAPAVAKSGAAKKKKSAAPNEDGAAATASPEGGKAPAAPAGRKRSKSTAASGKAAPKKPAAKRKRAGSKKQTKKDDAVDSEEEERRREEAAQAKALGVIDYDFFQVGVSQLAAAEDKRRVGRGRPAHEHLGDDDDETTNDNGGSSNSSDGDGGQGGGGGRAQRVVQPHEAEQGDFNVNFNFEVERGAKLSEVAGDLASNDSSDDDGAEFSSVPAAGGYGETDALLGGASRGGGKKKRKQKRSSINDVFQQQMTTPVYLLSDEAYETSWLRHIEVLTRFPFNIIVCLILLGLVGFCGWVFFSSYKVQDATAGSLARGSEALGAYETLTHNFGSGSVEPFSLMFHASSSSSAVDGSYNFENSPLFQNSTIALAQSLIARISSEADTPMRLFRGLYAINGRLTSPAEIAGCARAIANISATDASIFDGKTKLNNTAAVIAAIIAAEAALQGDRCSDPNVILMLLDDQAINAAKTAIMVTLVSNVDPTGPAAQMWYRHLLRIIQSEEQTQSTAGAPQVSVSVLGLGAETLDALQSVEDDFPFIAVACCCAVLVVLGIAVRSVVAPLVAVLSIAATQACVFALVVAIYDDGVLDSLGIASLSSGKTSGAHGQGGLLWMPPLVGCCFCTAACTDFSSLLLMRVLEIIRVEGPRRRRLQLEPMAMNEAVVRGLCSTASQIGSAALTMSVAFAGLLITPIPMLNQLGAILVVAPLFDAIVVRIFLMPCAMSFLGSANFWPNRTARLDRDADSDSDGGDDRGGHILPQPSPRRPRTAAGDGIPSTLSAILKQEEEKEALLEQARLKKAEEEFARTKRNH